MTLPDMTKMKEIIATLGIIFNDPEAQFPEKLHLSNTVRDSLPGSKEWAPINQAMNKLRKGIPEQFQLLTVEFSKLENTEPYSIVTKRGIVYTRNAFNSFMSGTEHDTIHNLCVLYEYVLAIVEGLSNNRPLIVRDRVENVKSLIKEELQNI